MDGYSNTIANAWNVNIDGCAMFRVISKLKLVKQNLRAWNHSHVGDLFENARVLVNEATTAQDDLDKDPCNLSLQNKVKLLRIKASKALDNEEAFLKQKSRVKWLK